jgi:phosphonate ABC transporter permease subunit PhnE
MILMPIGLVVGAQAAVWMGDLSQIFMRNLVVNICVVAVLPIFLTAAMRWSLPQVELIKATRKMRVLRTIVLVIAVILGIFWLYLFANLASLFGKALLPILGGGGFVGTFISDLGDILTMIIVLTSALMGAGVCNSLAGKIGMRVQRDLKPHVIKALNIVLCGLAGALLGYIIALGLNWLYSFENINQIRFVLIAIFSALGVLLAIRTKALASIPVGLVIYYISRTIFNALRSIEALIMVIVFVVWVGIGPFAGVLALSLHTIASLAKLYSEQVESIISGPVEAVKATGANNIQTIIYGVIPQIIPPYISFTMYRWDTNVRMSTIIGFAGGGGIGFLLIQNINLLNYRAASTQMIAIALVVASMDYLSSQMRERVV